MSFPPAPRRAWASRATPRNSSSRATFSRPRSRTSGCCATPSGDIAARPCYSAGEGGSLRMVSRTEPGRVVLDRIGLYRLFMRITPLRASYQGKFALAAAVGMFLPLAIFVVYLLATRTDFARMYPVLIALLLACFTGFLGTLWALRELLVPIDLTAEALRSYIESRKLPDLPISFPDRAGKLMEGTRYTLKQLHETITRLERASDIDDLTGVYNRRAEDKRLGEGVARGERDMPSFQVAFLDINEFK